MTFSFIKSEIREEIIGFMIAGEVGILPKNVSPSPVRGYPHLMTSMSTTPRSFRKMREKNARNRAAII